MSGRLSTDPNPSGTLWNYGPLPTSEAALYGPDGASSRPTHGRKSSLYRAQNSTLFSAFEEVDEEDGQNGPSGSGPGSGSKRRAPAEGVPMHELGSDSDASDTEGGAKRPLRATAATKGAGGSEGRSLVGRTGRENGFVYQDEMDVDRPGIGYGAGGVRGAVEGG